MTELETLCTEAKVTMRADFKGETTRDDGWQCRAWRVTLRYQGRQLSTDFYQGTGHTQPPSTADVLACLCCDARCGEQSFADWCSDFGYSEDSRSAKATHKACEKMAPRLRRLLGERFDEFADAEH